MEVWHNFVDDIKELDELEKPIPWQHLVCGLPFSGLFKETQAKNERRKSRSTYSMKGIWMARNDPGMLRLDSSHLSHRSRRLTEVLH